MFSIRNKKGNFVYLHVKTVIHGSTFYYFSKEIVGAIDIPDGYEVRVNNVGNPYIRKERKTYESPYINSR